MRSSEGGRWRRRTDSGCSEINVLTEPGRDRKVRRVSGEHHAELSPAEQAESTAGGWRKGELLSQGACVLA